MAGPPPLGREAFLLQPMRYYSHYTTKISTLLDLCLITLCTPRFVLTGPGPRAVLSGGPGQRTLATGPYRAL
jgi:hypothetical protein